MDTTNYYSLVPIDEDLMLFLETVKFDCIDFGLTDLDSKIAVIFYKQAKIGVVVFKIENDYYQVIMFEVFSTWRNTYHDRCSLEFIKKHQNARFDKLPMLLEKDPPSYASIFQKTSLELFLDSEQVSLDPELHCKTAQFRESYKKFCQDNNLHAIVLSADTLKDYNLKRVIKKICITCKKIHKKNCCRHYSRTARTTKEFIFGANLTCL